MIDKKRNGALLKKEEEEKRNYFRMITNKTKSSKLVRFSLVRDAIPNVAKSDQLLPRGEH